MTALLTAFIGATIPSLVVGIILAQMNRKGDERYKQDQEAAKERAEAAQIQMDMIMASAALSFAVACAVKRGTPNGEIEDGIAEYAIAKKKYLDHINSEYFKSHTAK